ncbi:MAG: hypothetical protein QXG48_06270 [Thermofilaceae archaeon]
MRRIILAVLFERTERIVLGLEVAVDFNALRALLGHFKEVLS